MLSSRLSGMLPKSIIDFNLLNFVLGICGTTGADLPTNRIISSIVFVATGVVFFIGSYILSRKMYLNKNL